jgi:hypothetical protein
VNLDRIRGRHRSTRHERSIAPRSNREAQPMSTTETSTTTGSAATGIRVLAASEPSGARIPPESASPGPTCRQLVLDLPVVVRLPVAPGAGDAEPPDPRMLGRALATIVEVHAGRRPAGQLRPLLGPDLFSRMVRKAYPASTRYTMRSVHTCQPSEGVIEACGRVEAGRRALALVARFEHGGDGWLCTSFDLLEPGGGFRRHACSA